MEEVKITVADEKKGRAEMIDQEKREQEQRTPDRLAFDALSFVPRFAYGDQAEVAEVTGTGDGTVLGTGFARFRQAAIPWRVRYDEVLLVLEGEILIRVGEKELRAGPRDCVWLPKGTELRYEAEAALVFYAIHPSNWAEAGA